MSVGRKEFLTIGLILICTTIFTAVSSNIAYAGQEASISRTFVYVGVLFLGGLLIFGVPIFIIYLISVIYSKKKVEIPTSSQKPSSERGMRYCSSCGQEIKKEATFCEFCGKEQ